MNLAKVRLTLFIVCVVISIFCSNEIHTETYKDLGNPFLDISIQPGLVIPLLKDKELFYPGGGILISGAYKIPGIPYLYAGAESGFIYVPVKAETSLFIFPFGLGADFRLNLTHRWDANMSFSSGYCLGILTLSPFLEKVELEGGAYLTARIGSSFFLSPSLSLKFNVSYQRYLGLAHFFSIIFGAAYHIPAWKTGQLEIKKVEVDKLFPVLFQSYNEDPPGKVFVRNRGRFTITDLEVSLSMKPYIVHPTSWKIPISVEPGEEKELPLKVLLNERILGILEGIKVSAELTIGYNYGGRRYETTEMVTIHLHDRNAIVWDNDRKASLFVSEKDPVVLNFAGHTASLVMHSQYRPVNTRFRMAVGLHSALSAYGLSYVIDPISPYAELRKDKLSVDFLRFPRQTLKHKAGDCDDLSVLYCALLESVGIETAFITVPGHIYCAFSLDMTREEANRTFNSTEDLIFLGDKVWLPVETTEINGGFLKSWQKGAEQWRENEVKGGANLYPMHDSWRIYPPVSLPEGELEIQFPPDEYAIELYDREAVGFINRELEPQVEKCMEKMRKNGESTKSINRLGVLYARYGLYEQAEREFQRVLKIKDYQPTLINLGNIYYQWEDFKKAIEYYERAYRINDKKPRLLLHLAETNYKMGLHGKTQEFYKELQKVDPKLAGYYAHLVVRNDVKTRGSEFSSLERDIIWEEEQ